MPGIYMASKAAHGPRWRALRAAGLPIVSTWIDESGPGETCSYEDLWWRNVAEASGAAVLIAYREPGETMKGALVEIGAALAHEVPVLWVGDEDGYTVMRHSGVSYPYATLEEALLRAKQILLRSGAGQGEGGGG